MNALTRKLWRTIRSTRGQFLAVAAVVAAGVAVYISMATAYYNLDRSKEKYYRDNNFADYYFHVVRAPAQVAGQIEALPGVMRAAGRIQKDVPLLREGNRRGTARLTGFPAPPDAGVNRLSLVAGRFFEEYPPGGGIEVLTDPQFFSANGLSPGSTVTVAAGGRKVDLTVVGAASGPEFIYNMKDQASIMPDPGEFGIIMIPQSRAEKILNMDGQINQVVLTFSPGADENETAGRVKAVLEPYGNLTSYPRKKQLSNAVLQGELDGLRAAAVFMPAIFLAAAAAVQFVILSRAIKAQRLQIGVMKALGYSSRQIMFNYTGYALAVGLCGAAAGILLGFLLASAISEAYAMYFNLPETIGGVNGRAIASGLALSLGVSLAAGLSASRAVAAVNPAESMRPEPPKGSGRTVFENCAWLWERLDAAWKMSLRSVGRKRARAAVTVMGVVFAVGLLVMSLFTGDAVNYMMDRQFNYEQRYDLLVRFTGPVGEGELLVISRLDGVIKTEPLFELPARIHFNGRSEEELLTGLEPGTTLKTIAGEDNRPLEVPDRGVLAGERTAKKLGLRVGDRVEVETLLETGPSRRGILKVAGISRQLVGAGSFISLTQAGEIVQEGRAVSGAMLKVEPGLEEQVERELGGMTGVSSISSPAKELENFNKNLESMIYSISVMVLFAVLLGFAMVYNSSAISFTERKREFASLRVTGFTTSEISGLLLKENAVQSLAGVALGLPFGRLLAELYIRSVSTDLYTIPIVIYPRTYLFSVLGGVFFIAAAHLLTVRGVGKLDLADVLKDRE